MFAYAFDSSIGKFVLTIDGTPCDRDGNPSRFAPMSFGSEEAAYAEAEQRNGVRKPSGLAARMQKDNSRISDNVFNRDVQRGHEQSSSDSRLSLLRRANNEKNGTVRKHNGI